MLKNKIIYFTLAVTVIVFSSCATYRHYDSSGITREKAINIAKHETSLLGWGHPESEMQITVLDERDARRENNRSPKHRKDELINKLKTFSYWKVMFDYKPGLASNESDAVVYVNRKDGGILSIYFGEIKGGSR